MLFIAKITKLSDQMKLQAWFCVPTVASWVTGDESFK